MTKAEKYNMDKTLKIHSFSEKENVCHLKQIKGYRFPKRMLEVSAACHNENLDKLKP